ncbi:MAG: segregation/condensation protein A, partial [Candidatus Hadarchaeia archaeon]
NLARDKKIDPWDVDINKLASLYVDRIRERKELDLRVTGRAISSASVLLRMKANTEPNNGESEEEEELMDELDFDMPDLGSITLIRQNHQSVTLSDLTSSLQEVLKEPENNGESKKKKENDVQKVMKKIDDYHVNIEKYIQDFHEKIALLTGGGENEINFTELLPKKEKIEIARNLLLALFLCSKGKIKLIQEKHFGDIHVKLLESPEEEYGN